MPTKHDIEKAIERPRPLEVQAFQVPQALREVPQWLGWRYERRGQRWTKVPVNCKTSGRAACDQPDSWTAFPEAMAYARQQQLDGVGFVFTPECPFSGIDLDDACDPASQQLTAEAAAIVAELDSYTEISPSGTGVKVFVQGKLPPGGRRRGSVEMYDRGRYFAVTGHWLPTTPGTPQPRTARLLALHRRLFPLTATIPAVAEARDADAELLRRAGQAANGIHFVQLFAGDTTGYRSASEADLALCRLLAFWTGPDVDRLDRLFRASGLYRPKWERADYRTRTLQQALTGLVAFAAPPERTPKTAVVPAAGPWEAPLRLNEVPAAAPFPGDVLPAPLAAFLEMARTALACPPDFLGLPMLVLAGAALGGSRLLEIKPGFCLAPCLYGAIVGRPGSAKSPALKAVAAPVYARQRRLKAEHDEALRLHQQDVLARQQDKTAGPPPAAPTPRRVWASDATVEALAPLLLENPRGLALIRDELAALVASLNQYKAGKGADREFYLEAWAGAPLSVDRKHLKEGALFIAHPFLGIIGGLPPDLLDRLQDPRGAVDGFLDRFLFAFPDNAPAAAWTWDSIPESATAPWYETLDQLWQRRLVPAPEGGERAAVVALAPCGRAAWTAVVDGLSTEMNDADFPDHLRGPWSKFRAYAGRLALVIHFLRVVHGEADEQQVDAESVRRAARLVSYFKSHVRKVYATFDTDPKVSDARRVLRHLALHPELTAFTRRELYNRLRRSFKEPAACDLPLVLLVQHGYLRRQQVEHEGAGRRTELYEINPLWERGTCTQNSHGTQNSEDEPNSAYIANSARTF